MKILVYKKDELIQEIELVSGQKYTAGRKDGSQILLGKLPGISREHFEIEEEQPGSWRINVLSEIKLIEFEGEDRKDFSLQPDADFYLYPYVFKTAETASDLSAAPQPVMIEDSVASSSEIAMGDNNQVEEEDFSGDEKTAIQSFSGLPYIKIIGKNGQRSEYFRLEGNLWVVGGHESASVYLREPAAAQSHFEISKTDKGFFIVDLGSKQGTEINGQRMMPKKPVPLQSGDIIIVGDTSLQFELRDKAFKRKVSNIPLSVYKNPLLFFDQDVAMVSLDESDMGPGRAEEVNEHPDLITTKKNKKPLLIAVAVVFALIALGKEFLVTPKQQPRKVATADPFGQLSPAEQKIVKQTYRLASQLYLNKNYELALAQLEKLHTIIPVYKESKKMEEDCINARDIQRQVALREAQKKAQIELERRVNSYISQCEGQYAQSSDVDGAKACLAPAADLDPNNARIAQLLTEVSARDEEQKIRQKMAKEQEEKIRRGRELYQKARGLHKNQKWLAAIEAYENHIHSGLPDPSGLVGDSKRKLASIENQIETRKNQLMNEAKQKYGSSQLREALKLTRKAQHVDPFDPSISSFLFQVDKELTNRMKTIYMDSVIEERFGNLEASRLKWEEILKKDIEDGEYYIKARRKLKQYGYQY